MVTFTPKRLHFVIAGLFVAAALLLWWIGTIARDAAQHDLAAHGAERLQWHRFILQREMERFEILPKILSRNREIVGMLRGQGDRWAIDQRLERFNATTGAADIYVMDRSGLTVAASNWNGPRSFVGERFEFRPYFKDAMRGRASRYFAVGVLSGRRGFFFSHPVLHNGNVLGVTVAKIDAARIEELLARENDIVAVSDSNGVIFLSTDPRWLFHTFDSLPPEVEQAIRRSRQYDLVHLHPLDILEDRGDEKGTRFLTVREPGEDINAGPLRKRDVLTYAVASATVPNTDWTIHLLSDTSTVAGEVMWKVAFASVLLAVLLSIAGLMYQRRLNLLGQIAHQQRERETLRQSEASTRSIIANTRAGLVTTDRGGNVRFMNPVATTLFGCRLEDVVDRPFHELLPSSGQAAFRIWLTERLAENRSGLAPALETVARRADGSQFPIEMTVSLMRLPGDQQLLITLHDLTDRKRAEEALRRAHDELEGRVQRRTLDLKQANERLLEEITERKNAEQVLRRAQDDLVQAGKLAVIGQMATGITHEINQPLAAIRCYADNAREFLSRERMVEVKKNLDLITTLTEHMASITGELKGFARRSGGAPAPVSLRSVLEQSLSVLAAHTRLERYRIHRHFPEHDVQVMGDAVRLQQVTLNLLKNAVDAMSDAPRREIFLSGERNGTRAVIQVRDTGPGIAPEHLASVFDPFFTTKGRGSGLGLGLSISCGIVHDYGGTIEAANHPDGGCQFTITLPLAAREVREAGQAR